MEITVVVDLYGNSLGTRLIRKEMDAEEPGESNEQHSAEVAAGEAQRAVIKLCEFSAHYFESHGVECASRKHQDVKQLLHETLAILDRLQPALPKVQYWYLRGKVLNILPDHSPEAEQYLSRAIKHDPSIIDAWNGLGESYWKAGNVQQAHDCFVGSLAHSKSKESLRSLSMVLRQMGKDASEREANVKESVKKAKEAVTLDVKDGISWMILGNAYLSLFFMANQDPRVIKQCVSAYNQAEKDPVAANHPDLHFNRATLYHYEEDYSSAMREFSLASALDPGWAVPREQKEATRHYLQTMAQLITSKGRLKPKRLSTLVSSLSSPEGKRLGTYANTKAVVPVGGLREGANEGKVFVGGVVAIVPMKNKVAYACVLVDAAGDSVGVTVYNLAQTAHFAVGYTLTIPDPILRHTVIQEEADSRSIEFWSIQVTSPVQLLLNGQQLPADKLAPSTIAFTAFSS